jgi:predicted ATPase
VRLFVDRAVAALPSFALTAQNAAAVARVCHRLDGIPLALELAAARLTGLSVEQIGARLDQQFRLLTGGSRTALPRQQTLAAAVGWSFDLLGPPERALFERLAVFAGGFRLEAAEAVCARDGLAAEDVLEELLRLVDKSLVLAEERADGGRPLPAARDDPAVRPRAARRLGPGRPRARPARRLLAGLCGAGDRPGLGPGSPPAVRAARARGG